MYREGEAPADPMPSSAGASLSHLNHRQVEFSLPFALVLSLATLVFGCSSGDRPKLVAVTGKVTMEGKGLTAGSINFYPAATNSFVKDNPSSLLQLDGSFTVKTFPFGDGIPPGSYKVTLAPELATRIKRPLYSNPESTPWTILVPDSGIIDQEFVVK